MRSLASLLLAASLLCGCPSDPCSSRMCPAGTTCSPTTGNCVVGAGGGIAAGGGLATGGGSAVGGGVATGGGAGGGVATGGGAGGGSVAPVPLATFCDVAAATACDRQIRCGFTSPSVRATCIAIQTANCNGVTTNARRAQLGLVTYDPQKAGECFAAMASFPCSAGNLISPPACAGIFAPDAGVGAPCEATSDCVGGFCRIAGGCGTCLAWAGTGQSCAAPTRCDPRTAFCPPIGADGGQVDGGGPPRCLARLADGMPCATGGVCATPQCEVRPDGGGPSTCGWVARGAPCDDYFFGLCAPTDYCRGLRYEIDAIGDEVLRAYGTCAPRDAIGAPCTVEQYLNNPDSCAAGSSCLDGTCKVYSTFSQPNFGECLDDPDCLSGFCNPPFDIYLPDGGPFIGTGHCLPSLDAGSACMAGDPCEVGTACRNGTCTARNGPGGACAAAGFCTNFLSCPDAGPAPLTCQLGAMAGQSCNVPPSVTCVGPLVCQRDAGTTSAGVCIPQQGTGGTCFTVAECASTICLTADGGIPGAGRPGTCRAYCY